MRPAAVVACAALLTLAVVGCGPQISKTQVVGKWQWNVGPGTLLVTLEKDGTGSLTGPTGAQSITWRIQKGNNFVFNHNGKDSGFLIESADENTIRGSDPQAPGQPIVWTRQK